MVFLLLPLALPFVFKYLRKYLPQDIESKKITDWLSFYGAYFGALIALITALIVFNYQRIDSVRPYILVSKVESKETYPEFVTYFLTNENASVNADTCKLNDPQRDERFFVVRIKNIGKGAAIQISLYDSSRKKAAVFNRRMKILSANDLTSIEAGGTFEFLFDFDLNKKYKVHKNNPNIITETLCFSYSDIYGNNYQQNIVFEYDRSTEKGGVANIN